MRCGEAAWKARSVYTSFATAAVGGRAADAVKNLISMIQYMPEISKECMKDTFYIPPLSMSKKECSNSIRALAGVVGQLNNCGDGLLRTSIAATCLSVSFVILLPIVHVPASFIDSIINMIKKMNFYKNQINMT